MNTTNRETKNNGSIHMNHSRALVWDWPTRIFHWTLALSFAAAWYTAESERFRDVHVMMGYTFAGLIVFRIVWGFIGSHYARFESFLFPPGAVIGYLKSLLARAPQHYAGHNPAGAMAIFALLGLGIAVATSGVAVYQKLGGENLEDWHEWLASGMLAVVLVHICGVIVSSFLHRDNLVLGMLTGWKAAGRAQGIRSSRPVIGIVLVAAIAGFWWTYLNLPTNPTLTSARVSEEQIETRSHTPDND